MADQPTFSTALSADEFAPLVAVSDKVRPWRGVGRMSRQRCGDSAAGATSLTHISAGGSMP